MRDTMILILDLIIQRVRTHAIPCPPQPPTKRDSTVLMANVILPPLVPLAAFATGQAMKTNRENVDMSARAIEYTDCWAVSLPPPNEYPDMTLDNLMVRFL